MEPKKGSGVEIWQTLEVKLRLSEFHLQQQIHRTGKNINIHHECEGGIEKSVPRITDWHHEAFVYK